MAQCTRPIDRYPLSGSWVILIAQVGGHHFECARCCLLDTDEFLHLPTKTRHLLHTACNAKIEDRPTTKLVTQAVFGDCTAEQTFRPYCWIRLVKEWRKVRGQCNALAQQCRLDVLDGFYDNIGRRTSLNEIAKGFTLESPRWALVLKAVINDEGDHCGS